MEFNFAVNLYFPNEITKVGSKLIPEGFYGDRRELQECVSRISTILTAVGESSAKAQGLQKVITSGERLRNSDHTVYILADPNGGSRGTGNITGMLKVGVKHLYLFDSSGNNHEVYANCILDFYVHESQQRMGLGKKLFETMLKEEKVEPYHLAIDKPSPKLLSFLRKHYGLENIIPQMNNFVLYQGFFDNRQDGDRKERRDKMIAAGISSSTSRSLSGGFGTYAEPVSSPRPQPPASPSVVSSPMPYVRPSPHRPVSTMGLILQHQSPTQAATPTTSQSEVEENDKEVTTNGNDGGSEINILQLEVEPEPEEGIEDIGVEDLTLEESEPVAVIAEPLPCKVQAAAAPHLDLKFHHSSLW